jgi:glycosyltransferase involved in cell wall biosynthesis
MSRRVLVVSHFFPPLAGGGVHRALAWTRYLPAHGWAVTIVCAGEHDYWVRDPSLAAPPDTEVIRVAGGSIAGAWARGRGDSARRSGGRFAPLRRLADWLLLPDAYAGWASRARGAVRARLARGGVDVLLTTSPPDSAHLAAPSRPGVPWVADFRDPWVGLHFKSPPTAWHRRRQEAMERAVLTRADLVLAASRTHLDALTAGDPAPRACAHLPNGFEPAPAAEVAPDPDHCTLVFTGTLSLMEDTATLLEAVHDVLAAHPEARRRLRVVLAGPYDADHEDRAVALGLTGIVRFPGALTHAESRRLQAHADLLLLWKPRGAGYATMVPGKLYEYLDSGRPLLALLPAGDEARALAERAGAECLAPGDTAGLARAIERRYMEWKREGRASVTRPAWLTEYTRASLAGRLAGMLDRLCEEKA